MLGDNMHLGIDAGEILTEQRGKSRYLHAVLASLTNSTSVKITLLCAAERVDVLSTRYTHPAISVADQKSARRGNYDVVWYPWNTIAFPTQAPKVVTIHDCFAITDPAKNFFTRRRERRALQQAARESDELITSSRWSAHQVSTLLDVDIDAINVVQPTPDASWYPTLDALPFPKLAEMPYILVLPGQHGPQNLGMFFHAFAHAFKKRDIRLVVCGEIDTKSAKRFAKIPHTQILTPDDNELRALYRNAAAVAIPASEESFSFIAAEASACGAAIIAANTGSLPELIGNSSLMIAPTHRKEWTAGLLEIIDDKTFNARLRAQAASNWNATSRTPLCRPLTRYL